MTDDDPTEAVAARARARVWLAQSQAEAIAQRHERDLYADDDQARTPQADDLTDARTWLARIVNDVDTPDSSWPDHRALAAAILAALDNPPTCDHLPPGAVEVSREVFDAPSGDWCVVKCMRGGALVVRYFTVPAPVPERPTLPTTPGSVVDVTVGLTAGSCGAPIQFDRPCRMIRIDADSLDHWIDTVGERWMDDELLSFVVVLDAGADA